jgi:hypothetical protein
MVAERNAKNKLLPRRKFCLFRHSMSSKAAETPATISQHVAYFCSRFLAYGVPLLFFLVTTSFYLKTYDSAQIKITCTQIGATILLLCWLVKILAQGRFPFKKSDLLFVAPFLAFLASGLIAYAHTPFKVMALDETSRRVFYMIVALITLAEMNTRERMTRLWRWLMAAAWFTIGYGFIQYLDGRFFRGAGAGLDPFIWRAAFNARVFSTFGNPNFYGNFLVILTPLILSAVLRDKGALSRPSLLLVVVVTFAVFVDKLNLGIFGGYDSSYHVVYAVLITALIFIFAMTCFWKVGGASTLPGWRTSTSARATCSTGSSARAGRGPTTAASRTSGTSARAPRRPRRHSSKARASPVRVPPCTSRRRSPRCTSASSST